MLVMPVQAEVAALRMRGRCEVEPLALSLIRVRQRCEEQQARLRELEQHLAQLSPICHARGEYITKLDSLLRDRERTGFEPLYSSLLLDTGEGFRPHEGLYQS